MTDTAQLLTEIYDLYPRNAKFFSHAYMFSPEHERWRKRTWRADIPEEQKQLADLMQDSFESHYVNDFSSDEYWCFEYIILLDKTEDILDDDIELIKSLGGSRKDLYVYVSKLYKYYYYYFVVTHATEEEWRFSYIDLTTDFQEKLASLHDSMTALGYALLSKEQIDKVVPDIETECVDMGTADIFSLLFTDLYSHGPYKGREHSLEKRGVDVPQVVVKT